MPFKYILKVITSVALATALVCGLAIFTVDFVTHESLKPPINDISRQASSVFLIVLIPVAYSVVVGAPLYLLAAKFMAITYLRAVILGLVAVAPFVFIYNFGLVQIAAVVAVSSSVLALVIFRIFNKFWP